MNKGRVSRYLGAGVLGLALACHGVAAQDWGRPPSDVPEDAQQQPSDNGGALALRIDRLEAALRRATGQIEELQNDNRKLADKLKRFEDDVEFRLSGKTGAATLPTPGPVVTAPEPQQTKIARRDDVFDPDANPNAPGAPKPLGSTAPSPPLTLSSHAPDEPKPTFKPLPTPPPEKQAKADDEPTFVPGGVPFNDSKQQFESAKTAYKAGQYADAEAQFKAYLDANKGVANAAEAIFYIGETYLQRSRPREAAEQYLKVSTEYPKSRIAPDAMLRLGLALARLNNTEQACATFAEAGKRYPTAKSRADHESQAHRCS